MNLPNKITITRICLIPLMMLFFYLTAIPYNFLFAFVIFVVAAATDFVDGYIARKYNMVTNMGKFLDPIADKVLVLVAFIIQLETNVYFSPIGSIAIAIIISRELIISAFRLIASDNKIVISADKSGKIKTVFQDAAVAFGFLLCQFGKDGTIFGTIIAIITYTLLAIAVILTVLSGLNYILKNKNVLKSTK